MKFPIGSRWITFFGNGWLVVTIYQADKHYINDESYSKIRFGRNFRLIPQQEKP